MAEIKNFDKLTNAVKNSNVGSSALAAVMIGAVVKLKDVRYDKQLMRNDDEETAYRVIYGVEGKAIELSSGLEAYSAIRCILGTNDAKAELTTIDKTYKQLITANFVEKDVSFLRAIVLEKLEAGSDIKELKFKCINKAMTMDYTPLVDVSSNDAVEKLFVDYCKKAEDSDTDIVPVFVPRCYEGYKVFRTALNKEGAEYLELRNALLETSLKPKFKKMLVEDGLEKCYAANVLQLTPVFEIM